MLLLNWISMEALNPTPCWTRSARALDLRESAEAVFLPNHMSVAKPRTDPPTSQVTQMDASSTGWPYIRRTKAGKREHVKPKKTAMGEMIVKIWRSLLG
jgi:hypothetical protein